MLTKLKQNISLAFVFRNLRNFSFIVNNPTTGKPCISFPQVANVEDIKQEDKLLDKGRQKWSLLSHNERINNLGIFIEALQKKKEDFIRIMMESSGKHQQCARLEVEVSIQMLRQDLLEKYPGVKKKQTGQYYYKSLGNILVVCDYRMVMLSCLKYLVSCGVAGNCLIFNPHRYGLPVAKNIQKLWRQTLPEFPLMYCPINNYADGLEYLVQKRDMGFVSFTGDIQAGNSFYHFMAQKSQILACSQFLLMSSDSAYVLKDLPQSKIKKAAQNLAMACFMSGGNLFISVKRIFVDEEVYEQYMKYFVEFSQQYKISHTASKATPIITSGHIEQAQGLIKQLTQYKGSELKLLTEVETRAQYKSLYISPLIYEVKGISTIEYWNKIYPMPICFVEAVSSTQITIEQINSSVFGITASIYSDNHSKIEQIGSELDVGVVFGNRWGFAPGVPYSPRKRSGKGYSFSDYSFSNITKTQSLKGI